MSLKINAKDVIAGGIKVSCEINDKEVGRAYLYVMKNDLHKRPFGYLEDVFVEKEFRGRGISKKVLTKIFELSKEKNCYKLVCTSRYGRDEIHKYYESLGFKATGKSFRMNFDSL